MARGITRGVIREAFQKLGGATDDIVRQVDNIADSANMMANPRRAFTEMVDEFGGIKYGDNFVMRETSPYGSRAPMYTGQNFTMKRLRPDDVEVIPPRRDMSGDIYALPGPTSTGRGGVPLLEDRGTGFIHRDFETGFTMETRQVPAVRSTNGSLSTTGGPTMADRARNAHIDADIDARMGNIDANNAKDARQRLYEEKMSRKGYHSDGSKMKFFERRQANKHWKRQDLMNSTWDEVDLELSGRNASSGIDWDGISTFAKENQLVTASAIAGTGLLGGGIAIGLLDND